MKNTTIRKTVKLALCALGITAFTANAYEYGVAVPSDQKPTKAEEAPLIEWTLWTGEAVSSNWTPQGFFPDGGNVMKAAGATAGQELRFYATSLGEEFAPGRKSYSCDIVEAPWEDTYCSYRSTDRSSETQRTEWDLEARGGYFPLVLTQHILDSACSHQDKGYLVFVANSSGIAITKIGSSRVLGKSS